MTVLSELDAIVTELAKALFTGAPMSDWRQLRLYAKYTPDGSVSGHDYDFLLDSGVVDKGSAPSRQREREIDALTRLHWRRTQDLGQPRWYKMIVTVERTGKFNVEFEYKDDYKEGDIMQRG
jgi:hypothetical protein